MYNKTLLTIFSTEGKSDKDRNRKEVENIQLYKEQFQRLYGLVNGSAISKMKYSNALLLLYTSVSSLKDTTYASFKATLALRDIANSTSVNELFNTARKIFIGFRESEARNIAISLNEMIREFNIEFSK